MLPIQSVFEWNRFLDFYAILLHRISSLLRAKREPERTAVPAGHESPSGAFKPQTGLQSKCRVFSAARSPLLSRRGRRRVAAPCVCFVPCAALASCRPLPQQLLPVSAAGRARRRCTGLFLRRLQRRRRSCSNPPASMAATELHKKNACVFLHKRFLGGAKQPKSEPLPSGASLAAISSKVMVFVPSL